jgi:hypothetical protein
VNRTPTRRERDRQQIRTVQFRAVDRNQIDLVRRVRRADVPRRGEVVGLERDLDDRPILRQRAPLALHAKEAISYLEHEIRSTVLDDWAEHRDPEPRCFGGDRRLGYSAFLVRRQHEHMFA